MRKINELKGLLKIVDVTLVQKKKEIINGSVNGSPEQYFYRLAFSDGTELFSCTSGKLFDSVGLGSKVFLGLNYDYNRNKLSIVDVEQIK